MSDITYSDETWHTYTLLKEDPKIKKSRDTPDCMLCHVTHEFQGESTLYSFPECQGTPCSKQAPYLKFK